MNANTLERSVSVTCPAGDDDDEVGDRSRNDRDDDQQREVARVDKAREHTDQYQHNRAGGRLGVVK